MGRKGAAPPWTLPGLDWHPSSPFKKPMLSRVADSLYWMARYLERAGHTARILDVHLNLMLDHTSGSEEERWRRLFEGLGRPIPEGMKFESASITYFMALDRENDASIAASITFARDNARQLREHISSEMWAQLNRLYLRLRDPSAAALLEADPHSLLREVIESISLFNGLTFATINHGECWQFLQIGRHLERASSLVTLVGVHFRTFHKKKEANIPDEDFMEWVGLLKSCAAFEAYCNYYTARFRPKLIAEFLLLGREFPQAVSFAAQTVEGSLKRISELNEGKPSDELHRIAGKLAATLRYGQIDEILNDNLLTYLENVRTQCLLLHNAIYNAYVHFPLENAIAA